MVLTQSNCVSKKSGTTDHLVRKMVLEMFEAGFRYLWDGLKFCSFDLDFAFLHFPIQVAFHYITAEVVTDMKNIACMNTFVCCFIHKF